MLLISCFPFRCQEGTHDKKDPSQLWAFDCKVMKNQSGKFKSNKKWYLKKEGKTLYCIKNLTNSTVLGINHLGEVIEEEFVKEKAGQLWKKGKLNIEGYYTLENPEASKVLTCNSNNTLIISDPIEHPKCEGKATLYRATNKMVIKKPHNHPPRWEKIEVNRLRQLLLKAAECVSDKTLHEIFMDITIEDEYEDICHLVNYKVVTISKKISFLSFQT